jgi:hypothetical protein
VNHGSSNVFNLIDADWIPVLYRNGRPARVGIWRALTEAGNIRQIAASNPMDNVALLRFLTAVLLWCRRELGEHERWQMEGDADGIPASLLKKLREHKSKFNLFDFEHPFMQTLSVKHERKNAVTELLHDLPSGSALNHFRHTKDNLDGLCPACCALGLVRWPCYATAGTKGAGKSMTASPNGNTPTYAFPVFSTLLQCFAISIAHLVTSQDDEPIWISNDRPKSLGPLCGLTWRSRSVLLDTPTANDGSTCNYCGSNDGGLVREIRFQPGWERLSEDPWAGDPHLVRVERTKGKTGNKVKVLISHPSPNEAIDRSAMLWRDLTRGVDQSTHVYPDRDLRHEVVVIGSAQALLKHAEAIRVSPSTTVSLMSRVDLSKKCVDELPALIKSTTSNRKADREKHPEINAALLLMTPDSEIRVRAMLNKPAAPTGDGGFLKEVYQPLVEQAIASTAPGSPLRRRVALLQSVSALDAAIKKAVAASQPSAEDDKSKRSRKEKSGGS